MYTCTIWWPKLKFELQNQLQVQVQIRKLGWLCITGALGTTPTAAFRAILNLPPFYLEANKNRQEGRIVDKWQEVSGIADLIIFTNGSVIGRMSVLGKSNYRTGPMSRKNGNHIPGGDTYMLFY